MENSTKVLTKLDFRTLKYCNLFLMKYQRRTIIWLIVVSILALSIAVYGYFGYEEPQYIFVVFGGVFALYSVYQMFTLEKKLDTTLVNFFRGRRVTTQTIEVDQEKITVIRSVDPDKPAEYDWAMVTQILEMPQYYMLMAGKNQPLIIDRSVDAILSGTKENLDNIIQEQAKLKPYKVTNEDIVKIPITYVHQEFPAEDVKEVENVVTETSGVEEANSVNTVNTLNNSDKEEDKK